VVGIFETGDAHDSELWADLDTVQSAFGRSGVSSVVVRLNYREAFKDLKRRLESDPQLNVEVKTEKDYFSSQSSGLTRQIGFLTSIVTVIMAFGALFGALNTMYSAVSARTAEIGTLRALGFGNAPVVASVMAEAMFLSLLGGVLGAGIAYVLFNDYSVSTLGGGFTQVAFNFAVTPGLVAQGLSWALAIGFLGGLAPAVRAARLPVTAALRG
jgi:putative ABC transport system permease protein